MVHKTLSLQVALTLIIVLVGAIGLSLVMFTDIKYRNLAQNDHRNSISQLLSIKSRDLVNKLVERQKELGYRLQAEPDFRKAFNEGDLKQVDYWLDQEFNRYFVTIGLIKLEKLVVFNTDFEPLASSSQGIETTRAICADAIRQTSQLPIAQRIKPQPTICLHDDTPVLSTIISIGGLRPIGYLQVVTDPVFIVAQIERELGMMIMIKSVSGEALHASSDWPDEKTLSEDYIVSNHDYKTSTGATAFSIYSASNNQAYSSQLDMKRMEVIIATLVIVVIVTALALRLLHNALSPLKRLQNAMAKISEGKAVSLEEKGYPEIVTPIRSINNMSKQVAQLVNDLKNEVLNHKITEDKLRASINDAEHHANQAERQRHLSRLTLQSIIDGVITTDTSGIITSMNPIAEQLTGWQEQDAIGNHLVKVARLISDTTGKQVYDPLENIQFKSALDEGKPASLMHSLSHVETPIEYITAPMRDQKSDIIGSIIIIHDMSVQRNLNRQLSFQATHDALTDLINRYEFERIIKSLLNNVDVHEVPHTLCYIDLDQFKIVNDTCGHTAGDELLVQIAEKISAHVNQVGTLSRLGGDEFGVLLTDCDMLMAEQIMNVILKSIQEHTFVWNDSSFNIGASIGAVCIEGASVSCDELLSRADAACNLAKDSGRNLFKSYTDGDDSVLTHQREMHWVSRINNALEEDRFQLYFQEILPLDSDNNSFIKHGEVLLRMLDKSGDIISPATFLPAAERYNLVTQIDEWVVKHAIDWLSDAKFNSVLSVNLSGKSLTDKDFLNFVVSEIKANNVNPKLLCFEITETAAISHLDTAIHFMTVLKKLGCTFALDDFGSGLSSFSYLTSLPVDYLKIDGSFVVDLDKDPMHYAMVKSINEVGHTMGIQTIAEYAASGTIIDRLREIGVDNAQGYAVSRPVPLDSLSHADFTPTLKVIEQ